MKGFKVNFRKWKKGEKEKHEKLRYEMTMKYGAFDVIPNDNQFE